MDAGRTALMFAAASHKTGAVGEFASALSSPPSVGFPRCNTVRCAQTGVTIAVACLALRPDLELRDDEGWTALMVACKLLQVGIEGLGEAPAGAFSAAAAAAADAKRGLSESRACRGKNVPTCEMTKI